MKTEINLEYFKDKEFEFEDNSINLIVGKNNIGKTNLLREIQKNFTKNKKIEKTEVYFLDLDLNPFDALKEPSDFNKNKESFPPSSYFLIKEAFEKQYNLNKISEEILSIIKSELIFDETKTDLEKTWGFKELGLSLEINTSQISSMLKKPLTIKGISNFNDTIHDVDSVGLGHLRIIMLKMLNLVLEKNKTENIILLIDEPEAFLHPNLIKEACLILKKWFKIIKTLQLF